MEENYDQYELEEDMALVERLSRATRIKQQQEAINKQNQVSNEAMQEAFKEAGIDQGQWQKILAENPELSEGQFKEGVKNFVHSVVKNRKAKAPIKQPVNPAADAIPQEETEDARWVVTPAKGFREASARYQPSEKLKEAASKSGNDDVLNMMVAEICDGLI